MNREKDPIVLREYLKQQGIDPAIMEEMIAFNALSFVERTHYSCSGHTNEHGIIPDSFTKAGNTPYLVITYKANDPLAWRFHARLTQIKVSLENRDYHLRAMYRDNSYTAYFPDESVDETGDYIHGIIPVLDINERHNNINYQLILPPDRSLKDPQNRNVTLLESFWESVSALLAEYSDPRVYTARSFHHFQMQGPLEDEQLWIISPFIRPWGARYAEMSGFWKPKS